MHLTSKDRLKRQALGQEIDRIPAIGGWMNGAHNIAALAGITLDQYIADPRGSVIKANLSLGCDAMVMPVIPKPGEIRTGSVQEQNFIGIEPEALLEEAQRIPDSESDILRNFDPAKAEADFRNYFLDARRCWGGMEPFPNYWELGGPFPLYARWGYVAFLSACAIYPQAVGKIWWSRSVVAREKAKILRKLYRELDLVPVLFCGEDMCNNQGPMVDPAFLRQHYFPLVKMILAPLVEEGIRIIHHCDGDVRPIIPDMFDMGFSGLQGFQYELGVDPADFRQAYRHRAHRDLLLMGGMSVSRTLPFGSVQDVRDEVDYLVDLTEGGRGLFLFTANVTGVEVPPENIRAGYEHLRTRPFGKTIHAQAQWPWQKRTGHRP